MCYLFVFFALAVHAFASAQNPFLEKPYLKVDGRVIYYDLGRSLNEQEILTYLKVIRQGGLNKDISSTKAVRNIKNGSQLVKFISYKHMQELLVYLMRQSFTLQDNEKLVIPQSEKVQTADKSFYKSKMMRYLLDGRFDLRTPVVESFLGGLWNLDPQVRLLALAVLRDLVVPGDYWSFINQRIEKQDTKMQFSPQNMVILNFIHETVQKTSYAYQSINEVKFKNEESDKGVAYVETLKLRRFISRFLLTGILQRDENLIKNMPVEVFQLLVQNINGEGYCHIPVNKFRNEAEILALIAGLENKNNVIRNHVAFSLIRLLRNKNIDLDIKLHLFKILIENNEYKDFLLQGWSLEEINQLSDAELVNIMNFYIDQENTTMSCDQEYYNDQYDEKDSSRFPKPVKENFWNKPIIKKEYEKKSQKHSIKSQFQFLTQKHLINTVYIFS